MTTTQIKTEIQKVLDNVPESALKDVLELLRELQSSTPQQIKLTGNLRQILKEDKELFETCSMIDVKAVSAACGFQSGPVGSLNLTHQFLQQFI